MMRSSLSAFLLVVALCGYVRAAVLTVTTTNNVSPTANEISLMQALERVQPGDEIRFNIPGPGPHYIETPATGYPLITNQSITINGYSQPGASPNTNSIVAPNNAKIDIVLDSRNGGHRLMKFPTQTPNDNPGYEPTDGAVLGVVGVQGFRLQGIAFLGTPRAGVNQEVSVNFVSFAYGASGQISGCWLGVDPDGKTIAGANDGVTGFRYQGRDAIGTVTNTILIDGVTIGVTPKSTNAVQQFNVIVGMPSIPIIIEGDDTRISGNFITVLPDGLHDFDVALIPELQGSFGGAIEIGRAGNNTLIGIDGDGVNDANERNVFGGMLPAIMEGYEHLIEFYGQNPGTNVVIAGNYFGVGIDGTTKFTNGVPILNGSGPAAAYRIGSNFDGVSDALEGNLVSNNYPLDLFPASDFQEDAESLGFLSQLNPGASVSLRGNSLINNFPFPTSPIRNGGQFWISYYEKALLDPSTGLTPTLTAIQSTNTGKLLKGTVPLANPAVYSRVVVDLYTADPVGMTNGMAAEIPELPQGFVQGLTYLGSFTADTTPDLDPQPGVFAFDISGLNVPVGTALTVTANYGGAGAGSGSGDEPLIDSITKTDAGITIAWTGPAILQSGPSVLGPWTDEETTGSSFTTTPTEAERFFRLQAGEAGPATASPPLTSPFSNVLTVQ